MNNNQSISVFFTRTDLISHEELVNIVDNSPHEIDEMIEQIFCVLHDPLTRQQLIDTFSEPFPEIDIGGIVCYEDLRTRTRIMFDYIAAHIDELLMNMINQGILTTRVEHTTHV
jgi:hypothetical protein